MVSLKNLCKYYFQCFSNKDIEKLSELFSEDITLVDWNIQTIGKERVLLANEEIFKSVKTIEALPLSLHEDSNIVCCEILIVVDKEERIQVMDVIEFNDLMKIKSIKAYKI